MPSKILQTFYALNYVVNHHQILTHILSQMPFLNLALRERCMWNRLPVRGRPALNCNNATLWQCDKLHHCRSFLMQNHDDMVLSVLTAACCFLHPHHWQLDQVRLEPISSSMVNPSWSYRTRSKAYVKSMKQR